MPTSTPFTRTVTIPDLIPPCKSVGAHLAAKLDLFSTDERTLTDELCDMLCLWLRVQPLLFRPLVGTPSFSITVEKTTPAKEVRNGADLELVISSPCGYKRCLIQAKVLDPTTNKLRCDTSAGMKKLRRQLFLARKQAGVLAFLLIYVPGRLLNGRGYGYPTYEQMFSQSPPKTNVEAFYGATFISADTLIDSRGRWRNQKNKIPYFSCGIPLWRFLAGLLLCRHGQWSPANASAPNTDGHITEAFHRLDVKNGGVSDDEWRLLQSQASLWLEDTENSTDNNKEV
jgi:hypothetical protein